MWHQLAITNSKLLCIETQPSYRALAPRVLLVGLHEIFTELIEGVVGQVHADIVQVAGSRLLVFVDRQPDQPIFNGSRAVRRKERAQLTRSVLGNGWIGD